MLQAALNLDASVGQLGFYGEQQEKLWCISKMESLHLWQWQAACEEEAEGDDSAILSFSRIYSMSGLVL